MDAPTVLGYLRTIAQTVAVEAWLDEPCRVCGRVGRVFSIDQD
jgi:hypothetical protein